ncbi:hypothetical protein BWI96_11705 [Siphonobacter sp. SORGH_AS_0500]|uniref:hypothetical protein n=1 Tax=Siphonobacter sp. SORGH_AS_0500 TaxID=1864824 RepID=UPI000CC46C72|nr:hypothetical protein [Siphonobacter sp. SORGH_AS_0500]PKK36513.1 hypothetical protein BWI96_11705 [Siphonobacter sp. SORGH_AS_0500]
MASIRIEKVGDINVTYPYLELFQEQQINPFMEIGITDHQELSLTIYPVAEKVVLTLEQWEQILTTAKEFLPNTLRDEEDIQDIV